MTSRIALNAVPALLEVATAPLVLLVGFGGIGLVRMLKCSNVLTYKVVVQCWASIWWILGSTRSTKSSLPRQNLGGVLQAGAAEHAGVTLGCRRTELEALLSTPERVLELVEKEAREVANTFGRPRRSAILQAPERDSELETISVIPNEPSIIVFSKRGYIKRMRADSIGVQNRGGRGAL